MPEVSVIIPAYNAARSIAAALASVDGQTLADHETIVIDDGSSDETAAIVEGWHTPVTLLRQPNRGPGAARNAGIRCATGRLVAFLDADDQWLPDKLARQVEYFHRYPQAGLVHTATCPPHAGAAAPAPGSPAVPESPRHRFCEVFHSEFFIRTLTVMVPRAVLERIGGFDERREIHIEDWDLWLRIAARYPLGYIPTPLAVHHPGGVMSQDFERTYAGQRLVIEKLASLCAEGCQRRAGRPSLCIRRRRFDVEWELGCERLRRGNPGDARAAFRSALRARPFDIRARVYLLASFFDVRLQEGIRTLKRRVARRFARPPVSDPAAPC
jgi:glycosyltransferase involved in cell wall biosynthesis